MKITRQMLLSEAFYNKSKFNGSKDNYNFRIEKVRDDQEQDAYLLTIWEGPECFDVTQKEKKQSYHPNDEAGMEEILAIVNAL